MVGKIIKKILAKVNFEYKYGKIVFKKKGIHYNKKITSKEVGNSIISSSLTSNKPVLVARIGASELKIILNYLHFKNKLRLKWSDYLKEEIWQQSGIFPSTDTSMSNFAKAYLKAIGDTDIMGVWYNEGENVVIDRYCNKAALIPLESIEPYFFKNPWSEYLKDKRILIIHPFESSIKHQYFNFREKLFFNKRILPYFNLQTIKAVQAQVFNITPYKSWEDINKYMQDQIIQKEFDIAIIGAGGYGLLLGSFVKSLGKKAIHMGGATQILFGIRGKRWDDRENFKPFFNQYWKYPNSDERPEKAALLEGGAYW